MAFEGIVAALDAALAGWQEGDDSQAFFGDLVESGFILDSMAIQMPYPLLLAGRLAAAVTDGDGAEEELRRARQLEEDLEWFIGAISSRPAPDIWRDLLDRLRFMVDDVADSVEKEEKNTRAKDDKGDGGLDDCTEPSAKKNKMNTGIEEDATPEKTVVEEGDKQKEGRPFFDDSFDIQTIQTIANNKEAGGGSDDVASQKTVTKEGAGGSADCVKPFAKKKKVSFGFDEYAGSNGVGSDGIEQHSDLKGGDQKEGMISAEDEEGTGDLADCVKPSAKEEADLGVNENAGLDDIGSDATSHIEKEDNHKEGSAVFDSSEDEKLAVKKERDSDIQETLDLAEEGPNVLVR